MSNKVKAIVAAVLALLAALWGGYVSYSDNDPTTNPDLVEIGEKGKAVYDAVKLPSDDKPAAAATVNTVPLGNGE